MSSRYVTVSSGLAASGHREDAAVLHLQDVHRDRTLCGKKPAKHWGISAGQIKKRPNTCKSCWKKYRSVS